MEWYRWKEQLAALMLIFVFHACQRPWPCKQGENILHLLYFFRETFFIQSWTLAQVKVGEMLYFHSAFKMKKNPAIQTYNSLLFQKRNIRPCATFSCQAVLIISQFFLCFSQPSAGCLQKDLKYLGTGTDWRELLSRAQLRHRYFLEEGMERSKTGRVQHPLSFPCTSCGI